MSAAFSELVRARYSCRAYRPDPVPPGHIQSMLEAARLAPSACNKQPWRFCVVTQPDARRRIIDEGFLPVLSKWASQAPVLIVLGIERTMGVHRLAPLLSGIDYPWIDAGIAGEHLALQASELGLGTCWIGWIKPGAIRKLIHWPRSIRPAIVFTVGWPADADPHPQTERMPMETITRWLE